MKSHDVQGRALLEGARRMKATRVPSSDQVGSMSVSNPVTSGTSRPDDGSKVRTSPPRVNVTRPLAARPERRRNPLPGPNERHDRSQKEAEDDETGDCGPAE